MRGFAFATSILLAAGAPARTDQTPYGECLAEGDSRLLKLDVSVDPTAIVPTRSQDREPAAPHTSTVRVTLTNPSAREVRLTFPNPCFLAYDVEPVDGKEVAPEEEGTVCADTLATVTLKPGGKKTKEFRWTARAWSGSYTPLPAGQYRIVGTLAKRYCGTGQEEPPLRTPPVVVEVRPAN